MKKLMTMIAAVAMSFGLFAESASHFISFETADECVQDGKLVKTGWTGDASVIGLTGGYNYIGADARRDADGEPGFAGGTDNDKCLKLETGSNQVVCTPGGDTDNVYFDQTVKFTGYEEAPAVTDGKIAVWMSAIEAEGTEGEDGYIAGETNLYVTCAKVNAAGEATPTNICIGAYDIDAWHRVTIKSLGDIAADGGRAGFLVYIDGVQVGSFEGIADADALKSEFQSYSASGLLFPALDAEVATVTAVAYQGIGELDDVAIDNLGPKFARFVEGLVAQIPGALLKITDENGEEIEVKDDKFQAAPGAAITLTYSVEDGKFLSKNGKQKVVYNEHISQNHKDFTGYADDVVVKTAVAQYNDEDAEPTFTDSLQEAINLSAAEDEVTLLVDTVLAAKLVIPAEFGAGTITLGENKITLAADQAVGIDILADGVTIDGGTIESALTANVAGSKAINVPNKNVGLTSVTIDAAHYEYAIYANCDDDCVAAGDKLTWFYDGSATFKTLNCDGVSITGNGSLFHVEGMTANLKDCSAVANENPLFGAAHQAAVYSSLNSLTTITGTGTYTHVNALQSGNLGGKITVAEGSTAKFTGNIKSYMKVGAHTELEDLTTYPGYKAQFTFNDGTYTGNIVFEDATARDLDSFTKAQDVVIAAPAGYKWDETTGILVPCDYVCEINGKGYETLDAAIAAATDGQTIKLLKDIETAEKQQWTISEDITIDFDDYTISKTVANDWVFTIADGAEVTFTGTTGGIVHKPAKLNQTNPASMIQIFGKLTVEGGKYESDYTIFKVDEGVGLAGELVVNDGTFTITAEEAFAGKKTYAVMNWSKATLNAGSFTGPVVTLSCDGNKGVKAGETIVGTITGAPVYKLQIQGDTYVNVPRIKGVAKADVTCVAESITDELEVVEKDGYVTVAKKAADDPVVPPEQGEIKPNPSTGGYDVTPAENVTEIDVSNLGDKGTYVSIPPQVNTVKGVPADKIKVLVPTGTPGSSYDITAAFTKTGDAATGVKLELNEEATVKIDEETIAVKPTIGENVEASEVDITAGEIAVKAIPGLTYELVRSTKLGDAKTEQIADTAKATATKVELKDQIVEDTKPAAAFYQIKVEAK